MKTKLFTFFLAIVVGAGTMFGEKVQIGDLFYNLDAVNKTAEVTYQSYTNYTSISDYTITVANIPNTIAYGGKTYRVTKIGNYAFYNCNTLVSVSLENNITSIGEQAFAKCNSLNSINFSDNIESIGIGAFAGCSSLTSVIIPNRIKIINQDCFNGCTGLTSVSIGDSVKTIGFRAFYDCRCLTSIVIPDGVKYIANETFWRCNKLSSVTIPKSVVFVGGTYSAFNYDVVNTIYYTGSITDWCQKEWSPHNVSVDYNLYIDGVLQQNIILPDSITVVGSFRGCSSLRSITLPNSVTTIKSSAFHNCYRLTSITIPVNVTDFGDYIFAGCNSLTSVQWNAKKPTRCSCIFYKKDSYNISQQIVSFTFGDEVEYIPGGICEGMTKLTSIIIPNSVTFIQSSAFYNCSNLITITIPHSVSIIHPRVFEGCSKLKEIIMQPETPPYIGDNVVDANVPIYVPCGALESYQATSWSNYNLQYQPYSFKLNVTPLEPHKGLVDIQLGNTCEASSLYAVPNDGYYFIQWSDGILDNPRNITFTQDTTIAAIFGPFTVRFVDDNDTILSSQEYEYGEKPVSPADPVKTSTAQYTYTFAGWTPKIVTVTKDKTYKATYTSTLNKYTITFMSGDSVLSADLWEYGKKPIYRGKKPTKAEDDKYTYTFNGWSPEIVAVVGDATYMATFTAVEKIEAVDNVYDRSTMPSKIVDNGTVYILMPNGKKYSIIGELIK